MQRLQILEVSDVALACFLQNAVDLCLVLAYVDLECYELTYNETRHSCQIQL